MQRWNDESDELGLPPKNLVDAKDRVQFRKEATHRMGQGGTYRLSAELVSSSYSLPLRLCGQMPNVFSELNLGFMLAVH